MKGIVKKMASIASCRAKILALVALGFCVSLQSHALEVVTKDGVTGEVDFVPTALTDPMGNAVIATVCAVAGIFLIIIGTRWIFRLCKGGI